MTAVWHGPWQREGNGCVCVCVCVSAQAGVAARESHIPSFNQQSTAVTDVGDEQRVIENYTHVDTGSITAVALLTRQARTTEAS